MRAARLTGAGLGLLALLLVLASARPETKSPDLGAQLSLGIQASGVVQADPQDPAPALSASRLLAGQAPAEGRAVVRNLGEDPVAVRLWLPADGVDEFGRLADVLRIKVLSDRGILASVGLLDLTESGSAPLVLGVGESANLTLEAWIPPDAPDDYQGEQAEASLEVRTEPVTGVDLG